jgi:hypothetical protein
MIGTPSLLARRSYIANCSSNAALLGCPLGHGECPRRVVKAESTLSNAGLPACARPKPRRWSQWRRCGGAALGLGPALLKRRSKSGLSTLRPAGTAASVPIGAMRPSCARLGRPGGLPYWGRSSNGLSILRPAGTARHRSRSVRCGRAALGLVGQEAYPTISSRRSSESSPRETSPLRASAAAPAHRHRPACRFL